jgi:hypothetical protein
VWSAQFLSLIAALATTSIPRLDPAPPPRIDTQWPIRTARVAHSRSPPTRPTALRSHSAYATNDAAGRAAANMDTSYLAQQVTTIIGQLHGLFDEIGVPSHERDTREAEVRHSLGYDNNAY